MQTLCVCESPPACCQQCLNKGSVHIPSTLGSRLTHSLAHHRAIKTALQSQVDQITERCQRHLERQESWRELRAEIAILESRAGRRSSPQSAARPTTRPVRTRLPVSKDPLAAIRAEIARVRREQRTVDARMVAARQVLVGEAAAVMGLKRWEIAGLSLPPVKEMRRECGGGR